MNRPLSRSYKRRERYIRQNGRITDKYQLHAWWLRGIADQITGSSRPPLHPDLYDEYDNGGWCLRNGYVVVNDLHALKLMIAETVRGLPYRRARFAQEHPDLFALLEQGNGENYLQ
jgi:hypothetical protein